MTTLPPTSAKRAPIVSKLATIMRNEGSRPAYQQLAAAIRDAILSGELAEGTRLPSELAITEQAGVSRSTVREALRLLQEARYIERSSPKIFIVRAHSEGPAVQAVTHALRRRTVTFSALHEALLILEPELTRLAAQRHDEDDLEALRRNLDQQREGVRDFPRWCRLDNDFHVAIAEASANAPLVLARATLGQVVMPTVAQFVTTERAASAGTAFHEQLFEAIQARDPELAALVARRHVEDFHDAWERSGLAYNRDIGHLIDAAIPSSPP